MRAIWHWIKANLSVLLFALGIILLLSVLVFYLFVDRTISFTINHSVPEILIIGISLLLFVVFAANYISEKREAARKERERLQEWESELEKCREELLKLQVNPAVDKSIAEKRLIEEMKQAKINVLCIERYTDKRRKRTRQYNVWITIISSIVGLFYLGENSSQLSGNTPLNNSIPLLLCAFVAFTAFKKAAPSNIIQSENELNDLDSLYTFYSLYFNTLEELWYKYKKRTCEEVDMMTRFYQLRADESKKSPELNKKMRALSVQDIKAVVAQARYILKTTYDIDL